MNILTLIGKIIGEKRGGGGAFETKRLRRVLSAGTK